jgi:tetrapyrrole methylase family protein/MazG family protein
MARLRGPKGCPWDKEQTHETLKPYMIEEAYETLEALDKGDDLAFQDELGDLFFQILFHTQIATEQGRFSMADVLTRSLQKMKGRHPHVFGRLKLKNSGEVLHNWEKIKRREGRSASSLLDGVPPQLPALLRAHRVQDKASRVGFDWDSIDKVFAKLDEELTEFRKAYQEGDPARIEEELGDILFSLVNLARFLQTNPEEALKKTISKFITRFKHIEAEIGKRGEDLHLATLEEMDRLWDEAKKRPLNPSARGKRRNPDRTTLPQGEMAKRGDREGGVRGAKGHRGRERSGEEGKSET